MSSRALFIISAGGGHFRKRATDSFVPTKTRCGQFWEKHEKKILHADIMLKMASWKLLSVDPNKNLYIFYR